MKYTDEATHLSSWCCSIRAIGGRQSVIFHPSKSQNKAAAFSEKTRHLAIEIYSKGEVLPSKTV